MPTDQLDVPAFVLTLLGRGWGWDRAFTDRLVHPTNHEFYLVYDASGGRLTPSRALSAHLALVILTPASKSKTFR
ncbi:MAG: hypothetical protein K2X87_11775 [Gemmataceae bacterium]|nr:hypothetical protein [Gemmataceae bacterium]